MLFQVHTCASSCLNPQLTCMQRSVVYEVVAIFDGIFQRDLQEQDVLLIVCFYAVQKKSSSYVLLVLSERKACCMGQHRSPFNGGILSA